MIIQDLNDMPLFQTQGTATVRNSTLGAAATLTKRKLKFESEAANFVSTFKAMVKEISELSAFTKVQYLEDRKAINQKLMEKVRYSDFEDRL